MSAALLPDSASDGGLDVEESASRSPKSNGPNLKLVYLQCYFVTIATILGTGILGLPVTLSHSGLYPFLVTFIFGFLLQALLIYLFTDVLQRAHAVQLRRAKDLGPENLPLYEMEMDEDLDDLEHEQESNGPVMAGHIIIPRDANSKPPNLHLIGELFLPCCLRQMFDVVLLIQFVALLISYALAGSEAYAQVIGIDHFYVIPVFCWILTFLIVFALNFIQPVVSLLTFAKASLFLGTVVVTFFVGAAIHHEVSNDFTYIGAPFLMGTVALGGVVNVMPFLYSKIQPVPIQVRKFRRSILAGLISCVILNILWCWAVLDIVPQVSKCFVYQVKQNNSLHTMVEEDNSLHRGVCTQNLSLENSQQTGEISTIPLTEIIHKLYPAYDWVALLVQLFIMISITVSFLTIGAAMHHTLSGWTESLWSRDRVSSYVNRIKAARKCNSCSSECVCRSVTSLMLFALVFIVAMMNPQGFEVMLEKVASLFTNLEAGLFIFIIICKSTNAEHMSLRIPLPLPSCVYHLKYLVPAYFLFAVAYDIFTTVYGLMYQGKPLPWEHADTESSIIPIEDHPLYANLSNLLVNLTREYLPIPPSSTSTTVRYPTTPIDIDLITDFSDLVT